MFFCLIKLILFTVCLFHVLWQINGWLLFVVFGVVVVSDVFSVVFYLVGSEMMSLKVDFPTEYRIRVHYHNCDFPQKVNSIFTSLCVAVYRLYVNFQGMPKTSSYYWLYTGR